MWLCVADVALHGTRGRTVRPPGDLPDDEGACWAACTLLLMSSGTVPPPSVPLSARGRIVAEGRGGAAGDRPGADRIGRASPDGLLPASWPRPTVKNRAPLGAPLQTPRQGKVSRMPTYIAPDELDRQGHQRLPG